MIIPSALAGSGTEKPSPVITRDKKRRMRSFIGRLLAKAMRKEKGSFSKLRRPNQRKSSEV
jgi:hypothetical protein